MAAGKILYRADEPDAAARRGAPAKTSVQTVDELSLKIRQTIAESPALRNVAVRGELQNFKRHSSGHVYFTLVGADSRIAGVMFRSNASGVISWPEDGDEILVTGSVDVYPKGGAYQIYATRMLPLGIGAQMRAKEELRRGLEREGLFDIRHKRPIPRYPAKVAVVTSPSGAALQDILKVSLKRSPFVDIVIVPALVQGVDAPPQIARALALAGSLPDVECAIVARGGGAKDDLSPFDDERVVRAIRSCPVPVVTGVGHQTDRTLADLAADAALPTPSAAAERVFPEIAELRALLGACFDQIVSSVVYLRERQSDAVDRACEKLFGAVRDILRGRDDFLKGAEDSVRRAMRRRIEREEDALSAMASRLDALSPLSVLARGYAICSLPDGSIVRTVNAAGVGDRMTIRVIDGKMEAEVLSKTPASEALPV
jgi:exodeoxyribonuclease VII large subunit